MEPELMEIPLVYPCYPVSSGQRYVLNDAEGTMSTGTSSRQQNKEAFFYSDIDQHMLGSASISEITSDKNTIVTTCALPVEPSVLSLTMSGDSRSQQRVLSRMELDLSNTSMYGVHGAATIKVHCFASRVVLIDARGIVLVVNLMFDHRSRTTMMPLTPTSCQVLSLPDLLQEEYIGAEISSSMVAFLSSRHVLIAMSPSIITLDLQDQDIVLWSQSQTLQEMKDRVGGILSKASDLILGRNGDDAMDEDVPPVSALCVAQDSNVGCFYVFTLHSDASLRHWRLFDPTSTPSEVVLLQLPTSRALPLSSEWSENYSAVHLTARVYGSSVCAVAVYIKTSSDEDGNTLTVFSTSPDIQADDMDSTRSLQVPAHMESLVGMEFSASSRCSLTALMKTDDGDVASVYYPPSNLSLVSNEPKVTRSNLDRVAQDEQERISKLSFPVSNKNDFEEEIHRMDNFYLKQLFRPMYPRGDGTVTPPLAETIRKAISKVMPGRQHGSSDHASSSIELETLLAIQEWRRKEHQQGSTPTRRRSASSSSATWTPTSVYESYTSGPDLEEIVEFTQEEEEEAHAEESKIAQQLGDHQKRWQYLLTSVYEEELLLRMPLCWSQRIVVRAGVTCCFSDTKETDPSETVWDVLDSMSLRLLQVLREDEDASSSLLALEAEVSDMVARAVLAMGLASSSLDLMERLTIFGSQAAHQGGLKESSLQDLISEVSEGDLMAWLEDEVQSSVYRNLPGITFLSLEPAGQTEPSSWTTKAADSQTRHAACSLYVQSADSVRQLRLGRCMLLLSLRPSQDVGTLAFRAYMHSLAVLWTCSQIVPMPATSLPTVGRAKARFGSPDGTPSPRPAKRLSFGDETEGILGSDAMPNLTTALDVSLIRLSHEMSDGSAAQIASAAFRSTFLFDRSAPASGGGPADLLPELGLLPAPVDSAVASDFPRLALRLMSPFLAFPPSSDSLHATFARKEAIAECLLIEANAISQTGSLSISESDVLRSKACELLLASGELQDVNEEVLEAVFRTLRMTPNEMSSQDALNEGSDMQDALSQCLQRLLYDDESRPSPDIIRLSMQPTARNLFLPLIIRRPQIELDDNSRLAVKALAGKMLRISNLMNRLSILERHTGMEYGVSFASTEGSNFLLKYIQETISEVEDLLPSAIYLSMDEYGSLWSFLFRHACSMRQWAKAYRACELHPSHKQTMSSYTALVTAMVDAGALGELIELCSSSVAGGLNQPHVEGVGDCVDLYEIVAETLVQSKGGDYFSSQSTGRQMEYLGYAYAAHGSRGHWKRAAQAMEARHGIMKTALEDSENNRDADPVDQVAALSDLALTSLAVSNAVKLISDPSAQFLVSGEVGPFPLLPFLNPSESEAEGGMNRMSKRGREDPAQPTLTPFKAPSRAPRRTEEGSRLSRFVTAVDLDYRAVGEMGRKTLLLDTSDAPSNENDPASMDEDHVLIGQLASLGYYGEALFLAKAMSKARGQLTGSSMPGGRDLLLASVSFLLRSVLVPLVADPSLNSDARPSLVQLLDAADAISGTVGRSAMPSWGFASRLPIAAKATAAGNLVRLLTTSQAAIHPPVVLEVAERFLDLQSQMPSWLESLLLGVTTEDSDSFAGLFARTPKDTTRSYPGDASALVGLYVKYGLYNEACTVVSKVLLGLHRSGNSSREAVAPSRLPEMGDIDFVPYGKIDALWDAIEQLLHDGRVSEENKTKLKGSRREMETALEKHFELMKISELGLQSARALR